MYSEAVNRGTDNTMSNRNRTIKDIQNTTHKTKDSATRIQLKQG